VITAELIKSYGSLANGALEEPITPPKMAGIGWLWCRPSNITVRPGATAASVVEASSYEDAYERAKVKCRNAARFTGGELVGRPIPILRKRGELP
jgi:hypothetical protein